MSKKQKRRVARSAPKTNGTLNTPAPVAMVGRTGARSSSSTAEFNPDYGYVKTDLKYIAVLAGGFITILVILSFFLR